MKSQLELIAEWLSNASNGVAFTGAGISTESGIPDFRSPGGVWSTNQPVYFDDFLASAEARYEYWRQKSSGHQDFATACPNRGHQCLAKWEKDGRLKAVLTQNIDGLHQDAGSGRVLELHGTARFVDCLRCESRFDAGEMVERFIKENQPPVCSQCGGLTKHATISFGQSLREDVLENAVTLSSQADLYFAMGSSLVVQPAAGLPTLATQNGARLVIINREPTPLDDIADAVVHAPIGETLTEIDRLLAALRDDGE